MTGIVSFNFRPLYFFCPPLVEVSQRVSQGAQVQRAGRHGLASQFTIAEG